MQIGIGNESLKLTERKTTPINFEISFFNFFLCRDPIICVLPSFRHAPVILLQEIVMPIYSQSSLKS